MKTMILILTISIFFACNTNKKILAGFDDESRALVDSLNKYGYVDHAEIGFGGNESDLYNLFIRVQNKLDTAKLVLLTNHKNPVLRVYSFWGLCMKKYPRYRTIIERHVNDKQMFKYNQGCIGSYEKVNEFYLLLVDPEATVYDDWIKLSKEEHKKYMEKLK
jgi:hypothetical protein